MLLMALAESTVDMTASPEEIDRIVRSEHWNPFQVLGIHPVEIGGRKIVAVRAFLPEAAHAWVISDDGPTRTPMQRVHPDGFFEATFPDRDQVFAYRLLLDDGDDHQWELDDPYRFPPVLSELDIYLLAEGTHYNNYEKLGAHLITHEGVAGASFAVWAPSAKRVSVIGDFNRWDGRRHPMRVRGSTGIWEL